MDNSNSKISEDKDAVIRCLNETIRQLNESLKRQIESYQKLQEELHQRNQKNAELTEALLKMQTKFEMFFAEKSEK